jgi:hypothetical protein
MVACVCASVVLGLVQSLIHTPRQIAGGIAVALAIAAVFGAIALWAVTLLKVYVGASHLRCPDSWGRYRDLDWASITAARYRRFFGMPVVRISASAHPSIWLPLSLEDFERFRAVVRESAGPDHPLSVALRQAA